MPGKYPLRLGETISLGFAQTKKKKQKNKTKVQGRGEEKDEANILIAFCKNLGREIKNKRRVRLDVHGG